MGFKEIEGDECALENWFRKAGLWQRWKDLELSPGERKVVVDRVELLIEHFRTLAWAERRDDSYNFVAAKDRGCLGSSGFPLTTTGRESLNSFAESNWRRLAAALGESRLGFSFIE